MGATGRWGFYGLIGLVAGDDAMNTFSSRLSGRTARDGRRDGGASCERTGDARTLGIRAFPGGLSHPQSLMAACWVPPRPLPLDLVAVKAWPREHVDFGPYRSAFFLGGGASNPRDPYGPLQSRSTPDSPSRL